LLHCPAGLDPNTPSFRKPAHKNSFSKVCGRTGKTHELLLQSIKQQTCRRETLSPSQEPKERQMILSGLEIEKHIGEDIRIEPYNRSQLNPNSYNLRLHEELMVYSNDILDMKTPNPTNMITSQTKDFN
jgi:hypothetical protein